MTHFKFVILIALSVVSVYAGFISEKSTSSHQSQTTNVGTQKSHARAALGALRRQRVCHELSQYPKKGQSVTLSFESGIISPLCGAFVRGQRSDLDRCGDPQSDRFKASEAEDASATTWASNLLAGRSFATRSTRSHFTWPSHDEMVKRGQLNLFTDAGLSQDIPKLYSRIEDIRTQTTQMCCGEDLACREGMAAVEVSVCKPSEDGSASDPCVHGGAYEMAGSNYTSIFMNLTRRYSKEEDNELYKFAAKNIPIHRRGVASLSEFEAQKPLGGKIVLTSYVRKDRGIKALEPTLYHEFGHACTMVKMQLQASSGRQPENRDRALNAVKWFDRVKDRCELDSDPGLAAYQDFWESLGETKELASCFAKISELNRTEQIDRACEGLCPGHYMEETVGVAFAMLNGDLSGAAGAVFPQTCDHMRDRQHPMVADVVECLAQHSVKFRKRLAAAYKCDS